MPALIAAANQFWSRAFGLGAVNYDNFVRIGHCLSAIIAGVIGALIARWFYATRDRHAAR